MKVMLVPKRYKLNINNMIDYIEGGDIMPSVSGSVQHASSRFGGIGGLTAIPSVPVCLINTSTGVGMYVLTTSTGTYTFNNVPAGNYALVEAWGNTGVASPADFSTATTITYPTPKDPPYSAIVTPIGGTNTVDSLSPNTLFATVAAINITGRNFIDSTISNTPLSIPTGVTVGSNILTGAVDGIWGTLPAGTAVNTVPPTYPYSSTMTSGLTYRPGGVSLSSDDYHMINIQTNQWFSVSNHTTFDETSSLLSVNGGDPNVILFYETVNVTPNSFYLAGAWLLMITNAPNSCLIGFEVVGSDGVTQLFYGQTSNIAFGSWNEIGQIFNTKNNSTVTIKVKTMSTVTSGNDFVLDDISLSPVSLNTSTVITKSANKTNAILTDTIVYTSVISTTSNLTSVTFQDTVPIGTTFNTGSVTVNGVTQPAFNPNTGFSLGNLAANSLTTVNFTVTVVSIPAGGQIVNNSNLLYSLTIIPGNTITNYITSNTVTIGTINTSVTLVKTVDNYYTTTGKTLNYKIVLSNIGNNTVVNALFIDTIPNGTTFVNNSVYVDGVQSIGGVVTPPGISLGTIGIGQVHTIDFSVTVN